MAYGITHPQYFLLTVQISYAATHTIHELSERNPVRAASEYPIEVAPGPTTRIQRQKLAKLLQVRYGKIDVGFLNLITGTIPSHEKETAWREISRSAMNDQVKWIGTSSWV
jgi:hypothetical protein